MKNKKRNLKMYNLEKSQKFANRRIRNVRRKIIRDYLRRSNGEYISSLKLINLHGGYIKEIKKYVVRE